MLKQLLFTATLATMAISVNAESKVLWEAESPEGVLTGWGTPVYALDAAGATQIKAGDNLVITVASVDKTLSDYPQVAVNPGTTGGWPPALNTIVQEPCEITFGVTYELAEMIHEDGISFYGDATYLSKVTLEDGSVKIGPNTVWFGPKQCNWGDPISIAKEIFANVAPYDKIEVEFDKAPAEHTLQFLFGGWDGANIPTYEAWKTNFLKVDEEKGVMNLILLPELDNLTWGEEGKEQVYDLFALLSKGGLIMQGPCLVNQVIYLPNGQLYNKVIESINEVEAKYNSAVEEITEKYPDYDLSEWKEIISDAIEMVKSGAQQAVDAANEDGELFQYAYDNEWIESMIVEMKKSAVAAPNQAAYDEVMAEIDDAKAEYNNAIEFIQEYNPEFDLTEMKEIIENAIAEAQKGAAQALETANEDGEAFFFPFSTEEILAMITEMRKMAVEEPNKAAYEKVAAQIETLINEYQAAITELTESYPEYDFTEWKEIIGGTLDMTLAGAKQALEAANEDGEAFQFAFDGEEIEAMIAQMREDVKTSGVASVNATDNASYYDLNGNKINNPKAGMYVKVVEGRASKVVIK